MPGVEKVVRQRGETHNPAPCHTKNRQKHKELTVENAKMNVRDPLQWGELDPYRRGRAHVGMWAWLLQRASAVCIVVFLTLHVFFTYKPFIQFLLLATVAFHAALGLRVILLDFNLVSIKKQRALVYWLPGIGIALALLVWGLTY